MRTGIMVRLSAFMVSLAQTANESMTYTKYIRRYRSIYTHDHEVGCIYSDKSEEKCTQAQEETKHNGRPVQKEHENAIHLK